MNDLLVAAKERLGCLGYKLQEGDEELLALAVQRTEWFVKNHCAIAEIPEGLLSAAADMAAGEFLVEKRAVSPDDIAPLSLSPAVKGVRIGDTQTEFAVSAEQSPEGRVEALISYLLNHGRGELSCYRKIRW